MSNGLVKHYPRGVVTDPQGFHRGPDYMQIDRTGWYVWEDEGPSPTRGLGRWSLHGPFKTKTAAIEKASLTKGTQ